MKNNYLKELSVKIINSKNYYLVYLMLLLAIIYPIFYLNVRYGVFFGVLYNLFSPCMMFIVLAVCISTIVIANEYNASSFAILRFNDKDEYLRYLIYLIIILNSLLILITFFILFFENFYFSLFSFQDFPYYFYGIDTKFYLLFYLIKTYFLLIILSLFPVIIFYLCKKKMVYFLYFFYFLSFFSREYTEIGIISSLSKFRLLPFDYFSIYEYGSFGLEIFYSSLYIFLLLAILNILYEILKRKKIEVRM